MVSTTTRDDMTWYECEECGLLFDDEGDARQHEEHCDDEDPSYIQRGGHGTSPGSGSDASLLVGLRRNDLV